MTAKRNRKRVEGSLRWAAEKVRGTHHEDVRKIGMLNEVLGKQEVEKRVNTGETVSALYREVFPFLSPSSTPLINSARRLQASIIQAKKNGTWTKEEQEKIQDIVKGMWEDPPA